MAGPARDVLGTLDRCFLCGSTNSGASVRLSAKGLAYVVHSCCQAQTFARSGRSDQLIRDRTRAAPPGAAPTAPATNTAPNTAPNTQAPPAVPAVLPATTKGIFGW